MDTHVSEKTLDNWEIPANKDRFNGCSECRKIFFGLGAFDKHRTGKHGERKCSDPASVGLSLTSRGFWAFNKPYGGPR